MQTGKLKHIEPRIKQSWQGNIADILTSWRVFKSTFYIEKCIQHHILIIVFKDERKFFGLIERYIKFILIRRHLHLSMMSQKKNII